MKLNVGGADRIARLVIGVALLLIGYFALSGGWAAAAYVIGAIALVTGVIQYCPANAILGINTREGGTR